jgi:hypothetical protein
VFLCAERGRERAGKGLSSSYIAKEKLMKSSHVEEETSRERRLVVSCYCIALLATLDATAALGSAEQTNKSEDFLREKFLVVARRLWRIFLVITVVLNLNFTQQMALRKRERGITK